MNIQPGIALAGAALLGMLVGSLIAALLASWHHRRRSAPLQAELATLQARVKTQAQLEHDRQVSQDRAIGQMRATFDALAQASLRSNSESFLRLAREHLGQHQLSAQNAMGERQQAIATMLAPIRELLDKTQQQIHHIEKERAETYGTLRGALESVVLGQQALQRETRSLVNALRRPEVRGQWGEMTLRRLAELAGMIEHCDFSEQVHVRTAQGSLRPDMIVHMPDGRELVVDVKTPLDAYLEAMEADSDERRRLALRRHAQGIAEHVRLLAAKNYWSQFDSSPDFVVLFIPGDQFLSAALSESPALLEDAIRQDVIIATPTSFIALLKAVAYGWRQMSLAQNAQMISTLGQDLYKRLAVFTGHLGRLGRSLGAGVAAYNSAVGSLEHQVLPGARKFSDLGILPDREIDSLEPIEQLAREPRVATHDEACADAAMSTERQMQR